MQRNSSKKIIFVVGTRPNFVKIAVLFPLILKEKNIIPILVHTGQHYDNHMFNDFFKDLNIPIPHINLQVGSMSHALQTAKIMERFEKVCLDEKPDFIFLVGDVNSTMACALVASKLQIKIIHYEAGLRSRDKSMPEEINRLVTDAVSDIYLTTTIEATENLLKENIPTQKIAMLGNLMIDTLITYLPKAIDTELNLNFLNPLQFLDVNDRSLFAVVTLHRPENVDDIQKLKKIITALERVSSKIPLLFPIHPRTYKNIIKHNLQKSEGHSLYLISPLGYLQFLHLLYESTFVITDSGGIQEETTYLNIPCLTIRSNTERPETLKGTNKLIEVENLDSCINMILNQKQQKANIPIYWDGETSQRIVEYLQNL